MKTRTTLTIGATLVATCLALASPAPGASQADGHQLLKYCSIALRDDPEDTSRTEIFGGAYCLGLVQWVLGVGALYQAKTGQSALGCIPVDGKTNQDFVRVVVTFLRDNPSMLDAPDSALAIMALSAAFPCGG